MSSQHRLVIIPGGGSVTGGQCHLREVVIGSRVSLVQRERAFEGCLGLVWLARFLVDLTQQIVGCNAGGVATLIGFGRRDGGCKVALAHMIEYQQDIRLLEFGIQFQCGLQRLGGAIFLAAEKKTRAQPDLRHRRIRL